MRAPSLRSIGEVFIAVAIFGALIYDLGFSSGSTAEDATGLQWKAQVGGDHPLTQAEDASAPIPAALKPTTLRLTERFHGLVVGISAGNTSTVCGNTTVASDPWTIGTIAVPQALVVDLGRTGVCAINPWVLLPSTLPASVVIAPNSWLSFKNMAVGTVATMKTLTMGTLSYLEADVSGLSPNSYGTTTLPLLQTQGACPANLLPPNLSVNTLVSNCPTGFVCAITAAATSAGGCSLAVSLVGPYAATSTNSGTIVMNKDCATFSQAQFVQQVALAAGVSAQAIQVTSWVCSSITATFNVLAANQALANQAVANIINSANNGVLKTTLAVTSATVNSQVNPYYYYYYSTTSTSQSTTTTFLLGSSSNPALFALLTLLAIPLLAALGIGLWCCLKKAPEAPLAAPMVAPQQYYTYEVAPTYTYEVAPQAYYTYEAAAPAYSYETLTPVQTPYYTPATYTAGAAEGQVIVPVPVAADAAGTYSSGSAAVPPAYGYEQAAYAPTAYSQYSSPAIPTAYTASSGAPVVGF